MPKLRRKRARPLKTKKQIKRRQETLRKRKKGVKRKSTVFSFGKG